MKHHPVIIITSNPDGMQRAIKQLELDGYDVKVLDSLSANLVDFFGAISNMDDDLPAINDTPDTDDVELDDDASTRTGSDSEETVDEPSTDDTSETEMVDSSDIGSTQIYTGKLNDEDIEVHEVPGAELVLHPRTISGSDDQVKFTLSESLEMSFWEEDGGSNGDLPEISAHLVVEELKLDKQVKIKISPVTMDPPVILMGEEWFANISSEPVGEKK